MATKKTRKKKVDEPSIPKKREQIVGIIEESMSFDDWFTRMALLKKKVKLDQKQSIRVFFDSCGLKDNEMEDKFNKYFQKY